MEQASFEVEPRLKSTDAVLHHIRDDGFIPGILYGGQQGNQSIQMDQRTF
ncbi:hypothetical protein [Tepidibacillus marianensis]